MESSIPINGHIWELWLVDIDNILKYYSVKKARTMGNNFSKSNTEDALSI
jgi:hypothetical protein